MTEDRRFSRVRYRRDLRCYLLQSSYYSSKGRTREGVWLSRLVSAGIGKPIHHSSSSVVVLSKKHSAELRQGPRAVTIDTSHQQTLMPYQCIIELPVRPALDLRKPSRHTAGMESVKEPPAVKRRGWSHRQSPIHQLVSLETEAGKWVIPLVAWNRLFRKYLERCMEIRKE